MPGTWAAHDLAHWGGWWTPPTRILKNMFQITCSYLTKPTPQVARADSPACSLTSWWFWPLASPGWIHLPHVGLWEQHPHLSTWHDWRSLHPSSPTLCLAHKGLLSFYGMRSNRHTIIAQFLSPKDASHGLFRMWALGLFTLSKNIMCDTVPSTLIITSLWNRLSPSFYWWWHRGCQLIANIAEAEVMEPRIEIKTFLFMVILQSSILCYCWSLWGSFDASYQLMDPWRGRALMIYGQVPIASHRAWPRVSAQRMFVQQVGVHTRQWMVWHSTC